MGQDKGRQIGLHSLSFCDLSTPKIVGEKTIAGDGNDMLEAEVFDDVYHDIKRNS